MKIGWILFWNFSETNFWYLQLITSWNIKFPIWNSMKQSFSFETCFNLMFKTRGFSFQNLKLMWKLEVSVFETSWNLLSIWVSSGFYMKLAKALVKPSETSWNPMKLLYEPLETFWFFFMKCTETCLKLQTQKPKASWNFMKFLCNWNFMKLQTQKPEASWNFLCIWNLMKLLYRWNAFQRYSVG